MRPSPHVLSRGNASRSTSATRRPARANAHAAAAPAGPAPMTSASWMDGALIGHYPTGSMTAKRKAGSRTRRTKPPAPARREAPGAGSGLAPGMQMVNSFLAVANVGATMEFLERAFGFARGVTLPDVDGQLRYAEMRHGQSVVMLIRKGDRTTATGGAS